MAEKLFYYLLALSVAGGIFLVYGFAAGESAVNGRDCVLHIQRSSVCRLPTQESNRTRSKRQAVTPQKQ